MTYKLKGILTEIINEYVTREGVWLIDYFRQSEDDKKKSLPYMYYYEFDEFLKDVGSDFGSNHPDELEHIMYGANWEEFKTNNSELYDQYKDWLYKKIEDHTMDSITDAEYPAWTMFDDSPELVKRQWLVHFTDDADGIADDGFTKGVSEIDKLGLTTQIGEFDKQFGGYNFSYKLEDYERYSSNRNGYKYGSEVVIFNGSGVRLWHFGDEEPQVIFWGNTAKNIIPITSGDEMEWAVYDVKTSRSLYESDQLSDVVDWVVKNYKQYHRRLHK